MIYHNREELARLLEQADAGSLKAVVLQNSLAGVFVLPCSAPAGGAEKGASKLGGAPDLPLDFPWPRCLPGNSTTFPEDFLAQEAGVPLHFILQINCNELAAHGLKFPRDHLLSFFAALHRAGYPDTGGSGDDWSVRCFPIDQTAPRVPHEWSPEEFEAVSSEGRAFVAEGKATIRERFVEFSPCVTLPMLTLERDRSRTGVVNSDSWDNLRATPLRLSKGVLIGGNVINAATPDAMHLVDLAQEFRHSMNWDCQDSQIDGCEEWVNLACIPTMPDINLTWQSWGAGMFVIRKEDLDAGRFERAVLVTHPYYQ